MALVEVARPRSAGSRRLAVSELVLDIAAAAGGERELEPILAGTLDRLRTVVRLTGGSIALVEDDALVVRAAIGPFAGDALGQQLPGRTGRSWDVVRTLRPFVSGDLQAQGLNVGASVRAGRAIRSWLGVPIVRRGEGIGLLEVDSTRRNAFGPGDVELLTTIGRALAGPVDLATRYASEQRARQLRDAFVGVISHELRTPITTIYGTSAMLARRIEEMSPDARGQAVADIEAESDRLRRLVEDLLVLSRAEGGRVHVEREPVLVAHVVRGFIASEAARWPEHTIDLHVPPTVPLVAAEETYVEQVVRNLVSNAAKYSPPGSTIEVVVEASDGEVRTRVLDEGIGLDGDTAERLFELFYRAPLATRRASGAGIGLFVCRELVAAMGGRIWARPRPEGGAEVGFGLPALPDDGEMD